MPRRAIDTIEKLIQGLTQRIAEGRQAGADDHAVAGLEHGLAEVRDALRGLTPAESLVGFNDAVSGLAHKIDLIVAQKDQATLQQLEHAITTLRAVAGHLEDRIVHLVQRLDASDSRLGHLEAIERGLGDLLTQIDEMRASKSTDALRAEAESAVGVDSLKVDLARTQNALENVNGTLSAVVDRLARIENDNRDAGRRRASEAEPLELP